KYDTLLTAWENPNLRDSNNLWGLSDRFTIAGLPRKPGDKSVDFAPSLFTSGYPSNSFWFFRGGPEFGTHRLTLDSAEMIITNPAAIDGTFSGLDVGVEAYDAGDLTGTGRPVMKTGGAFGHDQAFEFYYVLGDAIDDKIDIIVTHPHGTGAGGIPVDADGDKYGDLVYQAYSEFNDLTPTKSGLWVLHGSNKIPVHINPKYAAVAKRTTIESQCSTYPNPADGYTTVQFTISNPGNVNLSIKDVLGRAVEKKSFFTQAGLNTFQIPLDNIPNGAYCVLIENDKEQLTTKIIVKH
ncbi:MAG TPA: T9SS type A sorting domain-containing protein, partial [Candidatus Kapabacteria bacterium]|nr:T9SS type A sorting domain-containing protein [Candidatus Kapabacteria bacterium]